MAKYDGIDFVPPVSVANAAKKALEWRDKYGKEVKGGTAVGWVRANQLAKRKKLSPETVKRMYRFFLRHEKNKAVNPEFKSEPWKDNGKVAWQLWGGDSGKAWATKLWNRMEKEDNKKVASELLRLAGEKNPYLYTPPTKLNRMIGKEQDEEKKKLMRDALEKCRLAHYNGAV